MSATDTRRLLTAEPMGTLPRLTPDSLLALAEEAGLTGRGGAGFPTAIKVRAVDRGRGRRSSSATRWRASR